MTFKNQLDNILEKILISLMCILVLDVLWQVLSRYVLASPSSFTDELAGFLLIWVGLLGAAYVAGQKQHLAIDLLLQKSSSANQKRILRFINICIALFAFSVLIIGGSWLVITRFQFDVNSAALQIPLGYIYLVLPLSGLITLYYSIVFIVEPAEELN